MYVYLGHFAEHLVHPAWSLRTDSDNLSEKGLEALCLKKRIDSMKLC